MVTGNENREEEKEGFGVKMKKGRTKRQDGGHRILNTCASRYAR
jgi:hypothetical protein